MRTLEQRIGQLMLAGHFTILVVAPLIVSNAFFFPFVFVKATIFRTLVELMLLGWLVLAARNPAYRLGGFARSRAFWLYAAFVAVSLVSAVFGENFYLSFWGDMERSEGLLMHFHLLAYLGILIATVRDEQSWRQIFRWIVWAGWLMLAYALGQLLELGVGRDLPGIVNTQGIRLSSTPGNPAFYAALLGIQTFVALYLARVSTGRARWVYGVSALAFAGTTFFTATRGIMVALALTAVAGAWFALRGQGSRRAKQAYAGFLVVLILFGGLLKANPDAAWVQRSSTLSRIANISLTDQTVRTRLMTWEISLKGFAERPLLGNGIENFNLVFNRHFNPLFFEDEGSVVWFDRAHSTPFERLVTGGVLGFVTYFSLFVYAWLVLLRRVARDGRTRIAGQTLSLLLLTYFVQNLFIFDHITSYILFMVVLAYITFLDRQTAEPVAAGSEAGELPASSVGARPGQMDGAAGGDRARRGYQIAIAVFAVVAVPAFIFGTVKPALASITVARSFTAQATARFSPGGFASLDNRAAIETAYREMLAALRYRTYGGTEIRIQFAQYVDSLIASGYPDADFLRTALVSVNGELDQQLIDEPDNVASYLLAMRHYNTAQRLSPTFSDRALTFLDRAIELSPSRQHLYFEAGYSHVHKANDALRRGDDAGAQAAYDTALGFMEQAIALNPAVAESYINKISVLLPANRDAAVFGVLEEMDALGVDYHQPQHLRKIANLAASHGAYELANPLMVELNEIEPHSLRNMIQLALTYAYIGEDEVAIQIAERVRELFPGQAGDVDPFIQRVREGFYRIRTVDLR